MLTHTYYGLGGTVINLSVAAPANETDIEAGYELIRKFEKKLTVNREYSEVVAINNAAGKHA
nr:FAD:protein FMN transferase [Liquorilactobacillus satsumensis]